MTDVNEEEYISVTATKLCRDVAAGIGFKKQVRHCSEHMYISRITEDSIFASELAVGDEVLSIDVPVSAMDAVEVERLVRNSEGYVTITAVRECCQSSSSGGKRGSIVGKSKRRLLRRLHKVSGSSSDEEDCHIVTSTGQKLYRSTEAGVGFRRSIQQSRQRILIADIEEDSIFAGTDLCVDDEVLSVEVAADGRSANEVADMIRQSEGDITICVIPQYPAHKSEKSHSKVESKSSTWRGTLSKRSKMFRLKPSDSSTNTGLTVGTLGESAQFET
uniref:PDZ domain-containing protein n=1 Tax=Pseudictyota dubia TaxID=2749911 RepID=A0A7R9Z9R8_9STRA|mmetsp:Transcript_28909/g.53678  ORF Transcript_28909/g.53678 Transcript_28909/m.53678 type:complete len:275 (+) Transcript_28909:68-892(+)